MANEITYIQDMNLTQHQLLQAIIDKQNAPASGYGIEGQLVYDTSTKKAGYHNGTSWVWLDASALVNWTESNYTYSSKTGVKWAPNNAATNVDAVIQPKGQGGFLLTEPDGTTTGGNQRGAQAIDLQVYRDQAEDVASGAQSVTMGLSNKASGSKSFAWGYANDSTALFSTTLGITNVASGDYSISVGNVNIASGANSTMVGWGNEAAGFSNVHNFGAGNISQRANEILLGVTGLGKGNYEVRHGYWFGECSISANNQAINSPTVATEMKDKDGNRFTIGLKRAVGAKIYMIVKKVNENTAQFKILQIMFTRHTGTAYASTTTNAFPYSYGECAAGSLNVVLEQTYGYLQLYYKDTNLRTGTYRCYAMIEYFEMEAP